MDFPIFFSKYVWKHLGVCFKQRNVENPRKISENISNSLQDFSRWDFKVDQLSITKFLGEQLVITQEAEKMEGWSYPELCSDITPL